MKTILHLPLIILFLLCSFNCKGNISSGHECFQNIQKRIHLIQSIFHYCQIDKLTMFNPDDDFDQSSPDLPNQQSLGMDKNLIHNLFFLSKDHLTKQFERAGKHINIRFNLEKYKRKSKAYRFSTLILLSFLIIGLKYIK